MIVHPTGTASRSAPPKGVFEPEKEGRDPEETVLPEESRSNLAIDDKFEHDIEGLIEVGKEKGYLTYGDVNDMLPEEISSADDLDDLITTIGTQGIDLLDGPKFGHDKDFEAEEG